MGMMLIPRTDDPVNEARDLTNRYKENLELLASPDAIKTSCFEEYYGISNSPPRAPSLSRYKRSERKYYKTGTLNGVKAWVKKWIWRDPTDLNRYKAMKAKADLEAEREYERAMDMYRSDMLAYDEQKEALQGSFAQRKNSELAQRYFQFVLEEDGYSIDSFNEYIDAAHVVAYKESEGTLIVEMRFPSINEIPMYASFDYDVSRHVLVSRDMSSGYAERARKDTLLRIALRRAGALVMSDEHHLLETIVVHGYFQDECTTGRRITILKAVMPVALLRKALPQYDDLKQLFAEQFRAEIVSSLYSAQPHELNSVQRMRGKKE